METFSVQPAWKLMNSILWTCQLVCGKNAFFGSFLPRYRFWARLFFAISFSLCRLVHILWNPFFSLNPFPYLLLKFLSFVFYGPNEQFLLIFLCVFRCSPGSSISHSCESYWSTSIIYIETKNILPCMKPFFSFRHQMKNLWSSHFASIFCVFPRFILMKEKPENPYPQQR